MDKTETIKAAADRVLGLSTIVEASLENGVYNIFANVWSLDFPQIQDILNQTGAELLQISRDGEGLSLTVKTK